MGLQSSTGPQAAGPFFFVNPALFDFFSQFPCCQQTSVPIQIGIFLIVPYSHSDYDGSKADSGETELVEVIKYVHVDE
jgi:hypothetical protein